MSLPSEKAIRDLLTGLLGKDVDVLPDDPVSVSPIDRFTVAVYATDKLRTAAVVVCDLALSAYLASALSLLPPRGAADAISGGVLSEEMEDNLHEIYNVGSSLFNSGAGPHVRLYRVYQPDDELPGDVRGWLTGRGGRVDLTVDVPRYGQGRLSVIDTFLT